MITVFHPDGTQEEIPGPLTLEAAQAIVGGYVEMVQLFTNQIQMLANEEGLLQNLQFNEKASHISVRHYLVGNVILMTGADMWKH